jgi:hypothetical protein
MNAIQAEWFKLGLPIDKMADIEAGSARICRRNIKCPEQPSWCSPEIVDALWGGGTKLISDMAATWTGGLQSLAASRQVRSTLPIRLLLQRVSAAPPN